MKHFITFANLNSKKNVKLSRENTTSYILDNLLYIYKPRTCIVKLIVLKTWFSTVYRGRGFRFPARPVNFTF